MLHTQSNAFTTKIYFYNLYTHMLLQVDYRIGIRYEFISKLRDMD